MPSSDICRCSCIVNAESSTFLWQSIGFVVGFPIDVSRGGVLALTAPGNIGILIKI